MFSPPSFSYIIIITKYNKKSYLSLPPLCVCVSSGEIYFVCVHAVFSLLRRKEGRSRPGSKNWKLICFLNLTFSFVFLTASLTATNQNCTNEGQTVVVKIVEEFIPCMTCMCKVKKKSPGPFESFVFLPSYIVD